MTLSLQEISDRLELQDLAVQYSTSVDRKDWALYESLFTPDAIIDYTQVGGIRGHPREVAEWLSTTMPMFASYQHLVANHELKIDGDEAWGRAMLFNPMGCPTPDGVQVAFVGLWYNDRYRRTPDGWKFTERVEEASWQRDWPPGWMPE
ncbi:MAG TPA: nuclear transport factor 2 family protein [Acidimicrobiales bacterium]|jgi:hypothetical protein|nr:nuclear transport factor 2 family protein [Acidimicrobiales bacterium]